MRTNPPASVLGREHALLHGFGRDYSVVGFEGPLSIKTVRRGRAVWRTDDGEHVLGPGRHIVLNRGRRYEIEIDSIEPVETFCVFFADGFAEDVVRSVRSADSDLLDEPDAEARTELFETIEPTSSHLERILGALERISPLEEDPRDLLIALVEAISTRDGELRGLAARSQTVRPATQTEILRRVLRGRDRIESCWDESLSLEQIAGSAGMAPHHFHRSFRRIFGVTPLQYRTRLRLEAAQSRLESGDEPVQDVCVAVGFESVTTFTRLFRQRCGVTPARWRAEVRKIG